MYRLTSSTFENKLRLINFFLHIDKGKEISKLGGLYLHIFDWFKKDHVLLITTPTPYFIQTNLTVVLHQLCRHLNSIRTSSKIYTGYRCISTNCGSFKFSSISVGYKAASVEDDTAACSDSEATQGFGSGTHPI